MGRKTLLEKAKRAFIPREKTRKPLLKPISDSLKKLSSHVRNGFFSGRNELYKQPPVVIEKKNDGSKEE